MGKRLVIVFVLFWSFSLHAFEIRVRGQAILNAKVSHASTMLQVSGTLVDDLGRGLRQRTLKLSFKGVGSEESQATIRTGTDGVFIYREEFPPGEYQVEVRFVKDGHLDGDAQQFTTHLKTSPVSIKIHAPQYAYLSNPNTPVIVHVNGTAGIKVNRVPLMGVLELSINNEIQKEIKLDRSGRGQINVSSFLKPGKNLIKVFLAGSAFRKEQSAETEMRMGKELRIEVNAGERLNRLNRGMGINGVVRDNQGPVPKLNLRVILEKEGTETSRPKILRRSISTDKRGKFTTFFSSPKLQDGIWKVKVIAIPNIGEQYTHTADAVEWSTRTERYILNVFTLFAIAALLLFVAGFLKNWLEYRKKNREKIKKKQRKRELAFVKEETIVPTKIKSDAQNSSYDLNAIGGIVFDIWKELPLAQAQLILRDETNNESVVLSDSEGSFNIVLGPGKYKLEASKEGFVCGKYSFSIPHKGELSGFRIDLVSVPLKIRRLYEVIAEDGIGKEIWGYRTPQEIEKMLLLAWPAMDCVADGEERNEFRQILRALIREKGVDRVKASDILGAISTLVEESYYSGKRYSEATWFFVHELALRLGNKGEVK